MMLHSYKIALLGCLYLFGACSWAEDEVKVGYSTFPPFMGSHHTRPWGAS